MSASRRPFDYPARPIGSFGSLAAHLQVTPQDLSRAVRLSGARAYRVVCREGEAGGRHPQKVTYDAHQWLKELQRKINERLLSRISYPAYVVGGIPGRRLRDAVERHTNARSLLTFDVTHFFESTQEAHIMRAVQHALKCPPDVAATISSLGTIDGHLPRGAPTSSYLANLMFITDEPELVGYLEGLPHHFRYTRWVDDITISSRVPIGREAQALVTDRISAMLRRRNLKFTREKDIPHSQRKKRRAAWDARAILVHNIEVRGDRLIVPKSRRKHVRAGVHKLALETRAAHHLEGDTLLTYQRLRSKVGYMKHFGHTDIAELEKTLESIWSAHTRAAGGNPSDGVLDGALDWNR